MVTHFESIVERPVATTIDAVQSRGLWTRAVSQVQAAVCGLHGHDPMLQFEQGRMFLRCASCGHQSPGWDTGARRPRVRFTGDAARHQMHQSSKGRTRPLG